MKSEHMIHMVNQIALNFTTYPRDQAVTNIADHLQQFWERRMRQQLKEYTANGGRGLHELVVEAVQRLR